MFGNRCYHYVKDVRNVSKKIFTKETILKTAVTISKERGLSRLSMRLIAKKLNCSVSPIYAAFDSKDDLEKAVFDYVVNNNNATGTYFERNKQVLVAGINSPELYKDVRRLSNKFHSSLKHYDDLISLMKREDSLVDFTDQELESLHFDLMTYINGLVEKSLVDFKSIIDLKEYISILDQVTMCFIWGYTYGRQFD